MSSERIHIEQQEASSFGAILRRERKLRDISLREVSDGTKISVRFLEALERDEFSSLPGGAFNKGFLRAYALYIGLDPEEMVNHYLYELSRQRREPETEQGSLSAEERRRRLQRWLLLAGTAAVILFGVVLLFWWRSGPAPS